MADSVDIRPAEAKVVEGFPVVRLTNGVVVGNFSSPHEFVFDDGTVLPAVSPERSRELSLEKGEITELVTARRTGATFFNVRIEYRVSGKALAAIEAAEELFRKGEVDVFLVPLLMREALKEHYGVGDLSSTPFRLCVLQDRATKVVSSAQFAV